MTANRILKVLLVAFCITLNPVPAKAQIPTFDPSAIANVISRIQNLIGQLQQFKDMAAQLEQAKNAIGDAVKNAAMSFGVSVDLCNGIGFNAPDIGSFVGDSVGSIASLKPTVPSALLDFPGFDVKMMENPLEMQSFISENLIVTEENAPSTPEEFKKLSDVKTAMAQTANSELMALALAARSEANNVEAEIKNISDAVEKATTERDDVAANTTAITQMIRMIAAMNNLNAASLQTQAANSL